MEDTLPITSVTPTDKMPSEPLPEEPQPEEPATEYKKKKFKDQFIEDPSQIEMVKVIEQINEDVKMTKKEIRAKLNNIIKEREEKLFIKEKQDKELMDKKMNILDKLSDSIGESLD